MADKGSTIQDLLPLGVSLNLPPFLGTSSYVAAEDVLKKTGNCKFKDTCKMCHQQD